MNISLSDGTSWRYSLTARALHWILALLLAGMVAVGWYMMTIEHEPPGRQLIALHKSFGLIVFTLVVVRVLFRLSNRPPALPASVPAWQRRLSAATQAVLYLLMLAIPLAGYVGASYSKSGVPFFGLMTPRWAALNHDLAENLFDLHSTLVWVLVAAAALHVAGALKHWLIDKDGVFERMR